MNTSGTFEENGGLSSTVSEEEQFDALVEAVNSGDSTKVDDHFKANESPEPDAVVPDPDTPDLPVKEKDDTNETAPDTPPSTDDPSKASSRDTSQEPVATPQEELAALKAELLDLKRQTGRVPNLQSQLTTLQRELAAQKALASVAAKKATPPPAESPEQIKLRERINALKEIDPDTAEILEALASQNKPPVKEEPEEDITETIRKAQEDVHLQQQFGIVVAAHPDAPQIFEHPYWGMWKNQLTPDQRAWAESDNADQVSTALTAFKGFLNDFNSPAATPAAEVADVTQQSRDRKLTTSAASTSAVVKSDTHQDEDAFFNEMYNQGLKESGQKI